jgi:glucan phosphoethanolaminetransferase (alkaline phosphatase superfamily)
MLDSGIDFFHLLKVLFVLLISTSAISIYFKVRFETALPLTISSIVIVFYIFGIFLNLKLALLFLYCLIPIFFIYVIYQVKRNNNVLRKIISPGLLIYSIWILVTYYIYKNQTVIHHDDFSHWFLAISNSYNLDQIPIGIKSNVVYQDYPPGTTILAYILLKI